MTAEDRDSSAALARSVQFCCDLARRSKTQFYLTFFALPRPMFRDMCVLYAFMRHSDDLADDVTFSTMERTSQLTNWRTRLTSALLGEPVDDPILPAVVELVQRQGIAPSLLFDVITGMESDLQQRVFESFDELNAYCYHAAGAVGLCCIEIWKYSDPRAREAAVACGTAFQLTNILRDVAEDGRMGRCYLPQEDLRRFGVTPESLLSGGGDSRYQSLMKFEADRAREFFAQAQPLLEWLSPAGQRVQRAMLATYGGLLDEIEHRRFDVQSRRVRIPRWKKWRIALGCFWPAMAPR